MKRLYLSILSLSLLSGPAPADDATALTIYSTAVPGAVPPELYRPLPPSAGRSQIQPDRVPGYAVVRQDRTLDLERGRGELRFTDVAAWIDPTTVRFESLSDPDGTTVLEQNFRFDLVSQIKLLERFVDREIVVERAYGDTHERHEGTLLTAGQAGYGSGLVLQMPDGGIRALSNYSSIDFPELPGGLMTRPTLIWDVESRRGGRQDTRVSYETQGITWWADYNVVFTPDDDPNRGTLDVAAWVSIVNLSGASYEDARLKLIAGDVQRAKPPTPAYQGQVRLQATYAKSADTGFTEKEFFEYHLYTLGRTTTLPQNSTKQLELFDAARGVPADKLMVYEGAAAFAHASYGRQITDRNFGLQGNAKVDIYVRFENEEESGLGIPLPSGRIRVSQLDTADDSLEFIGEDVIDHTPKNETVLIRLGSAFDVVGERRQVDFRIDTTAKWIEETIEVKLRNHKAQPVEVLVKETLYRWVEWDILDASHEHEKLDARTIHIPVTVAPDGEETITYRVHYTW